METPAPIGDEAIEALDQEYRPFPPFLDWPNEVPSPAVWEDAIQALEEKRRDVDEQSLKRALDFVMRAAALDTGAIEGLYAVDRGFTLTVASQAAAWQAQMDERGADVRALFEAQLAAYELVLDAATKQMPITEVWVRRLHEEVCRPQKTYRVITPIGVQEHELPKGVYKTRPNHVQLEDGTTHSYAPVDQTPAEMGRFVDEISSREFAAAHPIVQASYAHYVVAAVHPFADGNGRVARALSSTFLYRSASVPLLVFADRRLPYFDALRAADEGAPEPFVRLTFDAGLAAVRLVVATLESATAPPAAESLSAIDTLLRAHGDLTHREMDEAAQRLLDALLQAFTEYKDALAFPSGVGAGVNFKIQEPQEMETFRTPIHGGNRVLDLEFHSSAPAQAAVGARFGVLVNRERDEFDAFRITRDTGGVMSFSIGDVHPQISAATEQRLRALVETVCGQLLTGLAHASSKALRESGYGSRMDAT